MRKIFVIGIILLVLAMNFAAALFFTEYAMLIYNTTIAILVVFLVLWFLYHFGPKKYSKNMKKIEYSSEAESIYKNVYDIHGEKFKKTRIDNFVYIFMITIAWIIAFKLREEVSFYLAALASLAAIKMIIKNLNEYSKIYKEEILPNYIKMISGNVEYYPKDESNQQMEYNYYASGFDSEYRTKFTASDYIKYFDGNTKIEIANVEVLERVDDCNLESSDLIFNGLFAHADSVKNVNYVVKISKNKIIKNKHKLDMDSSDFEEIFDIYSRNKVYTMRILTSDVMMLLWDFYQKYELKFDIILSGQKIYLRFYTGNIFNVKLFENSMNKKNLYMYYSIVEFIIELTKSINKALEGIEI